MSSDSTSRAKPAVMRQDRRKLLLLSLGCVAFVALGVWFILRPEQLETSRRSIADVRIAGWLVTPVFTVFLVLGLSALVKPTTVRIGPEGLTIESFFAKRTRPWADLSNFRVWTYNRSRMVVFEDENPSLRWLAATNERISGANSALPTGLPVKPERLVDELVAAKRDWG